MGKEHNAVKTEEWEREIEREFVEMIKRPGYDVIETVNEYGVKVFRCVRQKESEL